MKVKLLQSQMVGQICGRISLHNGIITIEINVRQKPWRRRLALMHEILHLVNILNSIPKEDAEAHYKLHLTAVLLLISRPKVPDPDDFRLLFKQDCDFSQEDMRLAIKFYNTLKEFLNE